MNSLESGRIGPKLVSSPNLQQDENSENICYCPECGARVRLVGREPEDKGNGVRGTLPDWLPAASDRTTPPPPEVHPLPVPAALPVSGAAIAPGLAALPSFPVLPSLQALLSLPAPVDGVDDDDEPTRVVRVSADYGLASVIPMEPMLETTKPAAEAESCHRKPPVPIRHHLNDADDVAPQAQAHPAFVPLVQFRPSDVTPVMATSSSVELPSHSPIAAPFEALRPPVQVPILETAPVAHDYYPPQVGASTGPTARDVATETLPPVRPRRTNRTALLFTVGLGSGVAVVVGLALSMRGPSPAQKQAILATPAAAIAQAPVISTAILAALPAPERAEPADLPAPTVSSKRAEPNRVPATAHETVLSESEKPKTKFAKATTPSTQQLKAAAADSDSAAEDKPAKGESAVEEDPFDAREAASALDSAAERASACRREADPSGTALVTITFAPSGRVTTATLAGPPFIGTATGSCIASTMRSAKVSAFSGNYVTVRKTVTIH